MRYNYEVKELPIDTDSKHIYGVCYKITSDTKRPLIIFAHGLASSHEEGIEYAERLIKDGYNVYTFDFCGGSPKSKSSGKTTEMSVMTEIEDLELVIETAKTWDFIDANNIILIGNSQGGMVAAVAALNKQDDIKGLILNFPAFAISDYIHNQFKKRDELPNIADIFGWLMVGRNYAEDVWDYDVYEDIKHYTKPVLIMHGDKDPIINMSYSEKAVKTYPNAVLKIIPGSGHGFHDEAFDKSFEYILEYLNKYIQN